MFTGTICIVIMWSITSLVKWGNFNLGNPKHHSMTKKLRSIHMYPLAIMSMYILQKSMKCHFTKTSTAIAISYQLGCLNKPTKTSLSCIIDIKMPFARKAPLQGLSVVNKQAQCIGSGDRVCKGWNSSLAWMWSNFKQKCVCTSFQESHISSKSTMALWNMHCRSWHVTQCGVL